MKNPLPLRFALLITLAFLPAGEALAQKKEPLAIGKIEPTETLKADMARQGKTIEMDRVVKALDGHLISALAGTRKFTLLGRSDLKDLLAEQDLGASGLINPDTAPAQGQLTGAKYRMAVTVDSFLEENVVATFTGTDRRGIKRRFQLSAQAKIYDTTTGELLDAPNFQLEESDAIIVESNQVSDAKRTDDLMPKIARKLAEKVAGRVVDVVFPAKVIDVEDTQVTINRGDGFGIKPGEIWTAYGAAKEIVDPDTGVKIKRKGKLAGKVKITSVEPTYSQGDIIEGKVETGAILNRPQEAAQ